MITLARVIDRFEPQLRKVYGAKLLPSHGRALGAMKRCRTAASRQMLAQCPDCQHSTLIPHSCGHRLCPHCQSFESQRWLERQQQLRVPSEYFLLTFTVPSELRALAFVRQRVFYNALLTAAWQTISTFAHNDKELKGTAGAIAVLHTHTRRMDYHPHGHLVVPAGAINTKDKCWRTRAKRGYLFSQRALARVFRGKLLAQLHKEGLSLPKDTPSTWVVHCKSVGSGDKALSYLGRYLYKGVVQEKDILRIDGDNITFRYNENTGKVRTRTLSGAQFLWQLLKHTLPKGFRRARNYGFLHHNSKRLIRILQVILLRTGQIFGAKTKTERPSIKCSACGGAMRLISVGICLPIAVRDTEPTTPTSTAVM